MAEDCCAPGGNVMIPACSGGSKVGQLSNQAAEELTQKGFVKMFCLAEVEGHLGRFVQSAKDVPEIVAVDGCEIGCAKAILGHAEVPLKGYLMVTGLGIEKNKEFGLEREDIDRVKDAVKRACRGAGSFPQNSATSAGCGCSCCS